VVIGEYFKQKLRAVFVGYASLSHELRQLSERIFCTRKIIVISDRGISSIPISSKSQGAVVMLALLILLWISYSTGKYVTYEHVISQKDREIWNTNVTNEGLQYQMADLHQNLAELNKYFENIKHLDQFSRKSPSFAKNAKDSEGSKFAGFVKADKGLVDGKAGNSPEGVQEILANIRSKVISRITNLENIINMTGINLKKVAEQNLQLKGAMISAEHLHSTKIAANKSSKNQGGPYYPVDDATKNIFNQQEFESEINYLTQLENVINAIPLSAPLKEFYVSSGFGGRLDPMRNSPAVHTGIDIASEFIVLLRG
jgi:murein DD-endopeptidase MepM/ murein hydrolase activator NlpD